MPEAIPAHTLVFATSRRVSSCIARKEHAASRPTRPPPSDSRRDTEHERGNNVDGHPGGKNRCDRGNRERKGSGDDQILRTWRASGSDPSGPRCRDGGARDRASHGGNHVSWGAGVDDLNDESRDDARGQSDHHVAEEGFVAPEQNPKHR